MMAGSGRRMPASAKVRLGTATLARLAALVVAVGAIVVGPRAVSADCGADGPPRPGLTQARGITFIGTVRSQVDDLATGRISVRWDVQRVYAGPVRPGRFETQTGPCLRLHLEVGERYLLSGPDATATSAATTLTWRVGRRGGLAFIPRGGDAVDHPAAVRSVRRIEDALPALVPGWDGRVGDLDQVRTLEGAWQRMEPAPFAAQHAFSAWTGRELLVVSPDRTAVYDPIENLWIRLLDPPVALEDATSGVSVWTGRELLAWSGAGDPGSGYALEPEQGRWRTLPRVPVAGDVIAAAWAGSEAVVITTSGATAAYDPATDTWRTVTTLLSLASRAGDTAPWPTGRLAPTSTTLLMVGRPVAPTEPAELWALDPGATAWRSLGPTPFPGRWPSATWVGDRLLFSTRPSGARNRTRIATSYDPATGTWSELAVDCARWGGDGTWTGSVVLDGDTALDPVSGRCYTVPRRSGSPRLGAVEAWTGRELIRWGGGTAEDLGLRSDGMRFVPPRRSVLYSERVRPSRPPREQGNGFIGEALAIRALTEKLPTYGGIWLDRGAYGRVVLALTEPDPELIARIDAFAGPHTRGGWRLVLVRSTHRELVRALHRAIAVSRRLDPDASIFAAGVDESANRLVLDYPPAGARRMRPRIPDLERELGVDVVIEVGQPGRDLGGGQ